MITLLDYFHHFVPSWKAFNHGMKNLILNPADYLLYKLGLALHTLNRDNNSMAAIMFERSNFLVLS